MELYLHSSTSPHGVHIDNTSTALVYRYKSYVYIWIEAALNSSRSVGGKQAGRQFATAFSVPELILDMFGSDRIQLTCSSFSRIVDQYAASGSCLLCRLSQFISIVESLLQRGDVYRASLSLNELSSQRRTWTRSC